VKSKGSAQISYLGESSWPFTIDLVEEFKLFYGYEQQDFLETEAMGIVIRDCIRRKVPIKHQAWPLQAMVCKDEVVKPWLNQNEGGWRNRARARFNASSRVE
jgi:hypothetical protein